MDRPNTIRSLVEIERNPIAGDRTPPGNVPQTVEGWDGGCGIDYATLRSWSMLDFEGERFRAAASTQS
ncbi:hypothetical protein, partial [Burkholderia multivorans]|uniref:hypothetical protein n=1 Tax=Burkholderia multivorans TaxID=87883 RepID=UPI0020B2F284